MTAIFPTLPGLGWSVTKAPRFASVSFPRSFDPHEYVANRAVVEASVPAATRDGLVRLGHDLAAWEDGDWRAGCVCAVIRDAETGLLEGAADPRRPSGALGW